MGAMGMMTRRVLAASVTAALLAALGAAPHPTTAATATSTATPSATTVRADADVPHDRVRPRPGRHRWTTTDAMVPVVTGPDDELSFDLDTRLYVPDNATARTPQPAILMTHGFGLSKTANEVVSTARFFAAHGYVVLTYTSSGFGASGGCVSLQSADYDVKSARQLIDAVLEPRRDVRRDRRGVVVGTVGGSYGGGIQLPLAAADRRIRATIVGRSWNDLRYSLDPNNYVAPRDRTGFDHTKNLQGVFKREWSTLFYASGNTQPAMGNGGCSAAKTQAGPGDAATVGSCPGYHAELCRAFQQLATTGDTDAATRRLIARASASSFIGRVRAPTLLVQGQSDTLFNLADAAATYAALRRRGVPVGMIWNSGGHGGYSSQPGECEVYDGVDRSVGELSRCYLTLRSLGWMDHWLRGTAGGRGPGFAYYRDWVRYDGRGPDDEQYGVAPRFPAGRTAVLTLSAGDRLIPPSQRPEAGGAEIENPAGGSPAAYTESSNFSGPDASPNMARPPREQPGQFAAFTTAPLPRAVDVVGIPTARLRVGHGAAGDAVFFAKTYDVAPDGTATLIHRLIAPARVPAARVRNLAPVRITLPGLAHRFGRGHRIRMVLCSTDQTSFNNQERDTLTFASGAGVTLRLPVVASG